MRTEPMEEEIDGIRRNFKRCQDQTVEAIINLRKTGDTALIEPIVRGIVWRYVQEETRPVVEQATADTPLAALGIDSLMMLEVVLDVQDALDVVIEDADLRQMHTMGDVIQFLVGHYKKTHEAAA